MVSKKIAARKVRMESAVDQEIKIELRDMVREAKIQTTLLQQEGKFENCFSFFARWHFLIAFVDSGGIAYGKTTENANFFRFIYLSYHYL